MGGILVGMRLALLALLLLTLPAWAEKVFVRNQPFKGVVRGTGATLLVELAPLLQALGVPQPEGVAVVESNGVQLVNLHDFARAAGARLVANPQLQTVDVNLARPRVDYILIHYTANWCGPCRQLQPTLQRIAGEQHFQLVTVDTDRESPERTRYIQYFEGTRFPFLVLLRADGRPVGRWSGSPSYQQLVEEFNRARSGR
jgi:thiol-disulfide isomerase/thioredoxin